MNSFFYPKRQTSNIVSVNPSKYGFKIFTRIVEDSTKLKNISVNFKTTTR